jgi:hypothetical protein
MHSVKLDDFELLEHDAKCKSSENRTLKSSRPSRKIEIQILRETEVCQFGKTISARVLKSFPHVYVDLTSFFKKFCREFQIFIRKLNFK